VDVKEWMSYECADEGTHTQNIRNSSTHSHASEEEKVLDNLCRSLKVLEFLSNWQMAIVLIVLSVPFSKVYPAFSSLDLLENVLKSP
jgi:hypothetical protein